MTLTAGRTSNPAQAAPVYPFLPISVAVALAVGLLVLITATVVTFMMPETYVSRALVLVRPTESKQTSGAVQDPRLIETHVELILSEAVLAKVIEQLDLASVWAREISSPEKLTASEALEFLRHHIYVGRISKTQIIEIRVYSRQPDRAAEIANAIGEGYQAYCRGHFANLDVEILDRGIPSLRPLWPNKPLNIALGIVIGAFAGLCLGGLAFLVQRFLWRRRNTALRTTINPPSFTAPSGG